MNKNLVKLASKYGASKIYLSTPVMLTAVRSKAMFFVVD